MEDASLDDFFAKKDKSKKKPKVKSGDSEDLTKSSKKEKKKDKDKINSSNSSANKTQERRTKPDDEEWNDFEEEKAVDYSGLRIQNLQQKEEVDREGDVEEEELDENGEVKERKEGASGPWKKSSGVAATPVVVAEEKPKPAPAPVSTGKYIPPSQRAGAAAALTGTPSSNSRRKKELPNVHSEFDFPTLATGPGQGQQSADAGGQVAQTLGKGLVLENKFSVLGD